MSAALGRVVAILGPTNTGKTHLAIERMLAHRTGMIGFPLRLLARENYERIVRLKGERHVALVTGEEKIIPAAPSWWVCTVESMPLDREVACLAVDEIQLCADPERGHIFTDRLLHARGSDETLFLGADTIKPLIQRLIPRAEFIQRTRLSTLSYTGYKKVTRLPPRSAIVAFSAAEVYETAELIRRQRGGTAVVLGALSPRTRNAQVALYQAGEVDYLVATDAIGMGLNMDIDHVAFARLTKFDGYAPRRLTPAEIAQIAGRAGRHMTNGTFGTTGTMGELDPELVEAVENHRFDVLKHLYWRNSDLDFRSAPALLKSLDASPPSRSLTRARIADDQLALQSLSRDPEIEAATRHPDRVRLLWEVCQIPDFRKVMSDTHARLLSQLWKHLVGPSRRLPTDWVGRQIERLDKIEGDIDTLVQRIAFVRTWTYISNRADWLADPKHWQEVTRTIEDRLSDALHERLTQRFIDRRQASLTKSLASGGELLAGVQAGGVVSVEGHPIGVLHGLRFVPEALELLEDSRAVLAAARRALKQEIARRVAALEAAPDTAFRIGDDGVLLWESDPVGELVAGASLSAPRVRVSESDLLGSTELQRIGARLERWLAAELQRRLPALARLEQADLDGAARGIAWQLVEALGTIPRAAVDTQIRVLARNDRTALRALGVVIGSAHVFMPALSRPAVSALRRSLWRAAAVWRGALPVVPSGPVSFAADREVPAAFYDAIGWPLVGPRAVRADLLDRFLAGLHRAVKDGALAPDPAWARALGCKPDEVELLLAALGWRKIVDEAGIRFRRAPQQHRRGPQRVAAVPVDTDSPFAVLRGLGKPAQGER